MQCAAEQLRLQLNPIGVDIERLRDVLPRERGYLRRHPDRRAAVAHLRAGRGEVDLRSQSPTTRDEHRSYYQVRLFKTGRLLFERRAFDAR